MICVPGEYGFDATYKWMKKINTISEKINYFFYECLHILFCNSSLRGCQICRKSLPIPEIKGRIYYPSIGFMCETNPFVGPSYVHKNCLEKELNKLGYKLIEDKSGFHLEDEDGSQINYTSTRKFCVSH
jgi:hypothetical protein